MVKSELNKKSPLRSLEKATQGGVGKGNIGVIASKRGVGKTACLVHIATDKLMRGNHVIHVSFSKRVDHIITWYEDIFKEISTKRNLEDAMDIHDEIIRNRVIMNFNQDGLSVERVLKSVKAMIENADFSTDAIIIDGFDFTRAKDGDVKYFKAFAVDTAVELWFSDSYGEETDYLNEKGIPSNLERVVDDIAVILTMKAVDKTIHLTLVKDHKRVLTEDLDIVLDPKTLLIAE